MTPTLFQSLKKLREILTRGQKVKVLSLAGLATINSLTEVLTASFVIVFAQLLTNSTAGDQVFNLLDLQDLSHGKKIFYASLFFGGTYIFKNVLNAFEVFYQNRSIQKMGYDFKKMMLLKFVKADYAKSLSRNASYNSAVVGDSEGIFTNALLPLSSIVSEGVSFISLIGLIIYMNPVLAGVVFILGGSLGVFSSKILFPLFYKWGAKIQEASLQSNQTLYQFFHGFKEIILLGKQDYFISSYNAQSLIRARAVALQSATNQLPRMVLEVLFIFILFRT
jgi:ABC-type multidrug transport system fused ATPase/permease subunit